MCTDLAPSVRSNANRLIRIAPCAFTEWKNQGACQVGDMQMGPHLGVGESSDSSALDVKRAVAAMHYTRTIGPYRSWGQKGGGSQEHPTATGLAFVQTCPVA